MTKNIKGQNIRPGHVIEWLSPDNPIIVDHIEDYNGPIDGCLGLAKDSRGRGIALYSDQDYRVQ